MNISSLGSSAEIVDIANRSTKRLGGKTSFALATVKGLVRYRNQRVRVRVDDSFEEEMIVNVVSVANGRYFGGGMMIAPDASLSDGLLDVTVVGDVSVLDFARHSGKLYRGELDAVAGIRRLRGRRVTLTAASGTLRVEADGESIGRAPASFECLPGALAVRAPFAPSA